MSGDTPVRLKHLGILLAEGADARSFLQGQLTIDLDRLGPERMLLAACNSPQGRVQAVVRLVQRPDAIAMILPSSIIDATLARLRKYVLRAKVSLQSGADTLVAHTLARSAVPGSIRLERPIDHAVSGGLSFVDWIPAAERVLVLAPPSTPARQDAAVESAWRLDEIRAGLPQVYPQTHESFVAQMLNLDLLDGISFEKGCYTGQEIIARTHFRGAIKRRMFRFSATAQPPAPGTRIAHGEEHAGEVVDAAATSDGCELLAVINLAQKDEELCIEGSSESLRRLELGYEVK